MTATTLPADLAQNPQLSRWIAVRDDGRLTVRTGKVELGQGAVTAILAMAAAELALPLARLDAVAGDTTCAPDEGITSGSQSIELGGAAMRHVAALVRERFERAARQRAGRGGAAVQVADGRFRVAGAGTAFDYLDLRGEVDLAVSAADLPAPVFRSAVPDPAFVRLDLPAKLAGAAFVHDLQVPGMAHGRVLRPAHPAAVLATFDRDALAALPGVLTVVVDGSFVGLVARSEREADVALARAARLARWRRSAELPRLDDQGEWMETLPPQEVATVVADGAPAPAVVQRHAAAYSRPHLAHASLAPSCALAQWQDGRLTVHSHTQNVYPLRGQLAAALDVAPAQVDVIHAMGAGCYGHNGADDVALDAALLARAAGVPVLCRWSRHDEMTWSPFGAPMRMRLSAGLDAAGRIVDWTHDVYTPPHLARPLGNAGIDLLAAWQQAEPRAPTPAQILRGPAGTGDRNAVPLYDVGRRRITHHLLPQGRPLRTSAIRALGAHGNVFAIESFLDELAGLAGQDPLAFRLAHLQDPRARAVLEAAARAACWDPDDAGGEGLGRGLGFARYKNMGGYCAIVARVEMTETIRVRSIHAAVDCGAVVHPDGLLNQIEGGIVQALSWTLKEQVTWDEDGIVSRDWEHYPILGFAECPPIDVTVLADATLPPLGAGECAAGPTAAAVGNAVAHALGVRVRHLPITAERVLQEIHAAG
jgi:CO/xanthine dehydrogenase Mo-binding subunit